MSATYPMDMVRGRITVQVCFSFLQMIAFVVVDYKGSCNNNWRKYMWSQKFDRVFCLVFADREIPLSVPRNVPCFDYCA